MAVQCHSNCIYIVFWLLVFNCYCIYSDLPISRTTLFVHRGNCIWMFYQSHFASLLSGLLSMDVNIDSTDYKLYTDIIK